MTKAVLLDASSFIYRSYFASPKMVTPDGQPVGAIYGFCAMLLHLLRDHMGDIFVTVQDCSRKTFRTEIYDAYKSNRPPAPDDLRAQFPLVGEACEAFGIQTVCKEGFEADDIIATYACDLSKRDCEVEIVSIDKDLMQLITDKVSMFDAKNCKKITRENVLEKFGVEPEEMIYLQALMGDSVDNVPGIAGIGPKTAAKLISQYKNLENLYEHLEYVPEKVRKKLVQDRDNAFLSLKLVTLKRDVDVEKKYASVHYNSCRIKDFLRKYNFLSLLNRVDKINPCCAMF